ncbi:MAG: ubiquitin-like small modifier protein 1 [Candidatus Hodarchaeales archaeon]
MVTVRFFTILREITGKREIIVALPPPVKIKNVLDYLVNQYPELIPNLFEDDNRTTIKGYYQIVINGRALGDIDDAEMMEHVLDEKDVLAILPPVAGGQIVINGRALGDIDDAEMMEHVLDEKDVLAILPPVAGG